MIKFLKIIRVIQEKESLKITKNRKGYIIKRLNPWNPLTYIVIIITLIIGILLFGFIGVWSQIDKPTKMFKYK